MASCRHLRAEPDQMQRARKRPLGIAAGGRPVVSSQRRTICRDGRETAAALKPHGRTPAMQGIWMASVTAARRPIAVCGAPSSRP